MTYRMESADTAEYYVDIGTIELDDIIHGHGIGVSLPTDDTVYIRINDVESSGQQEAESLNIDTCAELLHQFWVDWSQQVADNEDLSGGRIERWESRWSPYDDLDDDQQETYRILARRYLDDDINPDVSTTPV